MTKSKIAIIDHAAPPPAPVQETAAVLSMIDRVLANPDIPVERIEQLFDLHRRVQADQSRRDYYAAFPALQADLPAVARKGKGHGTRYARYEDIVSALREPLAKHGFSVSFRTAQPDGKLAVTGVLAHEGGHSEEATLILPLDTSGSKNAVQAYGSTASYGKRYCLLTLLGIATEDDDDGKAASGNAGFITGDQAEELAKLISATGTDIARFLAAGNIESLSDMPASQFAAAKALLLRKQKEGAR